MFIKFCMARTTGYLSLINSAMLLLLVMDKFGISVRTYAIPIYVLGAISLFLIGYVEVKYFKGQQEESKLLYEYSPYAMLMLENQKKILDHLGDSKK